jgi:hypothetical protein
MKIGEMGRTRSTLRILVRNLFEDSVQVGVQY